MIRDPEIQLGFPRSRSLNPFWIPSQSQQAVKFLRAHNPPRVGRESAVPVVVLQQTLWRGSWVKPPSGHLSLVVPFLWSMSRLQEGRTDGNHIGRLLS